MKPALYADDGSCGGASDVAVFGEQKVLMSKSDNSSGSGMSVYLLSEPKGTSSKSAAADEKGSPEAREIWRRLEGMPAPPGRSSEYVTNTVCHCCRKFKPTGVTFHCGKHTYCSSNFERRFGFPAVHVWQKTNDIDHCPVCILRCTCKKCNERLMDVEKVMKAECIRQGCGPCEVQMDNLFELAKSGVTVRFSSKQAEKTSSDSKSSAVSGGLIGGMRQLAAEEGAMATSSTGPNHLDKLWYENLERLKPCIVDGKMDYSSLTDEKVKKQISDFVYRQRRYFKMRQNNEGSPLTDERLERLQALQALHFPFEYSKSTSTERDQSSPKNDVIVSLKDPSYKQIMEEYFKKLGAKTNQKKKGELTEKEAADKVFGILKNKGDRFVKLTNPHNLDSRYTEIDDEEALKKICRDLNRRMESANRWLPKSSAKNISSAPNKLKRKNVDKENEHATKRPFKSTNRNERSHEITPETKKGSRSKSSVHGCPLEYVGNYIANHVGNHVEGWEVQQRTNRRLCSDYYVIYRKGCNKKSAVEGKDKFTGYAKLALWAFETGYYTEHVVETEEGKEILEKLGIECEPYSIFNEALDLRQRSGLPAQLQAPESTTASSEDTREERQDTDAADRQVGCPQNSASNSNSSPAEENSQESQYSESARNEQQSNLAGSHGDTSGAEPQSNAAEAECPFAGFDRFSQTARNLTSSLSIAQERRDELGIDFFGHLNAYIRHKSNDTAFVMQFRSDRIDAAVQRFRFIMEQIESSSEGKDTFKNLADILIDQSKTIFPLS